MGFSGKIYWITNNAKLSLLFQCLAMKKNKFKVILFH